MIDRYLARQDAGLELPTGQFSHRWSNLHGVMFPAYRCMNLDQLTSVLAGSTGTRRLPQDLLHTERQRSR